MALTADQRTAIRLYAGWQDGFGQFESRLEQAMNYADSHASVLAWLQNLIGGTPPGLLAQLADIDSRLTGAYGRLKADQVGSITLNRGELQSLRSEGRRLVRRMCSILGVDRGVDVYSGGGSSGGGAVNFVGR